MNQPDTDQAQNQDYPELERLAAGSEIWEYAKDFDKLTEASRDRENYSGEFSEVSVLWTELSVSHFYVQLALEKKIEEVARGILASQSANNWVVRLNLSRALIEHLASIAHQVECVKRAVGEIQKTQSPVKARSVTERHLKVLDRLYYGGHLGLAKEKKIHINDMLKSANKYWGEIGAVYERLCEFIHPNYGSNLLVSSGELGRGQVGAISPLANDEIAFFAQSVEHASVLCRELGLECTIHLMRINQWVQLVVQSEPKSLTEVFSVRTATKGDGSSKENAIEFKKARNHFEAIEAFYTWAEKQKIEIHKRRVVTIEDGWVYDVAATSNGAIWVRYKAD